MKEIEVLFEKIGDNGVSIGRYNGKVVFSYGVIPGERAKILITQEKKNFIKGEVLEILEKSPYRIEAKEDHYLSCSPWQTFDYKLQVELKKKILKEIIKKFKLDIEINDFFTSQEIFEYRTKIEFSFLEEKELFLAFHKRENPFVKVVVDKGCILIDKLSNEIALELLNYLNSKKIRNLKSLIIRRSINFDERIFCLLSKDKKIDVDYKNNKLTGFVLSFSNPKSPASNFDEILKIFGNSEIKEKILDKEFLYSYNSFFQNNIEMFEKALSVMKENCKEFYKIVDLYCGVGVIGIVLSEFGRKIYFVDIEKQSINYVNINSEINGVRNFEAINLASEKIPSSILENTDLLILDPPRSGLHKKLINKIIETKPKRIFYLSCNPLTQARDFSLLKEYYKVEKFYGLDFYPNTPHIESLMILSLK